MSRGANGVAAFIQTLLTPATGSFSINIAARWLVGQVQIQDPRAASRSRNRVLKNDDWLDEHLAFAKRGS